MGFRSHVIPPHLPIQPHLDCWHFSNLIHQSSSVLTFLEFPRVFPVHVLFFLGTRAWQIPKIYLLMLAVRLLSTCYLRKIIQLIRKVPLAIHTKKYNVCKNKARLQPHTQKLKRLASNPVATYTRSTKTELGKHPS